MFGSGVLKGMWVTLTHFFESYIYDVGRFPRRYVPGGRYEPKPPAARGLFTIQYPEERMVMYPRFRGSQMQKRNPETGEPNCTACGLCARMCPSGSIKLTTVKGEDGKRKIETYVIDLSDCMVCGLCVEACPFDALYWAPEYENAAYRREDLFHDFDKLLAIGDKYFASQKE